MLHYRPALQQLLCCLQISWPDSKLTSQSTACWGLLPEATSSLQLILRSAVTPRAVVQQPCGVRRC